MTRMRYRTLSSYLKEKYGQPVRKLGLDAGFTCPNRDGSISQAGCIFCEPRSFSFYSQDKPLPLYQQLREGIAAGQNRGVHRFLAYFQAYTNTYAPFGVLKDAYCTILAFPEIVGLSIGTRPDCIDQGKLELINSFTDKYEVWMDYGLQSIHASTLQRINRGHTADAFYRAVELTRQYPKIKICAHVILGLPGENSDMEMQTACALASLCLEGLKLHPLHVVRNTALAREYAEQKYAPLSLEEYVVRAVRFLEATWPQTIIHRLSADSLGDHLIAPHWLKDKHRVLQAIQEMLEQENSWQGKNWQPLEVRERSAP